MMARPDLNRRYAIFNREFTIRPRGGQPERRSLISADDLGQVLAHYFRLPTDAADVRAVWEKLVSYRCAAL